MSDAEILRKISSRHVCGNIKKIAVTKMKNKAIPLFQVFGQASRTKRGEGDNGPWIALLGRFEAVCITDDSDENAKETRVGTLYAAPQCFLPDPMDMMIAEELEATEPVTDDDGNPVLDSEGNQKRKRVVDSLEFALEIGIKPSDTPIGYEYTTKPLIKTGSADPLADLRQKIPALSDQSKTSGGAKGAKK